MSVLFRNSKTKKVDAIVREHSLYLVPCNRQNNQETRREYLSSLRAQLVSQFSHSFCWTINIPTGAKIRTEGLRPTVPNKRLKSIEYGKLTPSQQIFWLRNEYMRQVLRGEEYCAFFELTKEGNVHVHMIVDATGDIDYAALTMRKYLTQCSYVQQVTKNKKVALLHTNYIHTWKEKGLEQWIEYITKDYITNPIELTPKLSMWIENSTKYNI